ncbi:Bgt-66 [Blumeria graminis f. sp. tritici]|uniref:Bgt-66 n=2 Tax=Blumeria graminis f. sp. tritici TaxID=62690 RepID=A0A381LG25_BLUGR|nr:78-diamino-pelargonic acid aminotransferase [Blumeria graminis f. sp. tritici 96224]VDB93389.1 Bgt-66 [Blumeria graminis f. sp. tritici]
MLQQLPTLWRSLKSYQIYGANTDVGKTIMSVILCKSLSRVFPSEQTWYLKPVSTGPFDQADDVHISRFSPKTKTRCLHQLDEPVSPHLAAQRKPSSYISDVRIRGDTISQLHLCAKAGPGTVLVETAGGVNSPTPSGTIQSDMYRPLRLPVCLVADSRLGGISATISAYESLHIRGYDVNAILQFENSSWQNHVYLQDYFKERGVLSMIIPPPPSRLPSAKEEQKSISEYYTKVSTLDCVEETLHKLISMHENRIQELDRLSSDAHSTIWYPFTQHKLISPQTIMPIDSASGDFFQTIPLKNELLSSDGTDALLSATFDGSASWWTQGIGHGSPNLSLAAAYAAGRYGHVIFAGNIHAPALQLAKTLLNNLSNPRLSRVFFSDNGSTGIEVATKMALTATSTRYKYSQKETEKLGVVALKGSYHGDTIGAMDCSEPGIFNEKVHWYQGRGYWFEFPRVSMRNGQWRVTLPEEMFEINSKASSEQKFPFHSSPQVEGSQNIDKDSFHVFPTLAKIFDIRLRLKTGCAELYREYIFQTLQRLTQKEGRKFGAVIMEPVILGAGGMQLVDPLFQHILVDVVRTSPHLFGSNEKSQTSIEHDWRGLPIIFDEVFAGIYRLGRFSAASFLQTHPDISVHAKLLTGGLVPLCCTTSSESIFEAFFSSSKADALLHGHSYTAHPVGCHVANTSLQIMMNLDVSSASWQKARNDWWSHENNSQLKDHSSLDTIHEDLQTTMPASDKHGLPNDRPVVWSVWSYEFISKLSCQTMEGSRLSVIALGSVLAIDIHDEVNGYTSNITAGLQEYLLKGSEELKVHVRVLGSVIYVMASQTSEPETLRNIEAHLFKYFDPDSGKGCCLINLELEFIQLPTGVILNFVAIIKLLSLSEDGGKSGISISG